MCSHRICVFIPIRVLSKRIHLFLFYVLTQNFLEFKATVICYLTWPKIYACTMNNNSDWYKTLTSYLTQKLNSTSTVMSS